MCLLIAQPRGVTFSKTELRDYLTYNGDGFGACVAEHGTLRIVRILDDAPAVLDAYYSLLAGRKAMLHFRMATHGTRGLENCHPFLLTPEIACAHNGIMDIDADPDTGASDTRMFCDRILAPIARDNPDALFTPELRTMLGGMIGEGNRLMFMRADGRVSIVNEASGVTHRKAWLSNTYAWSSPEARRRNAAYARWWAGDDDITALTTGRNVTHTPHVTARMLTADAAQDRLLANRGVASAEDGEAEDDIPAWSDALCLALEEVENAWMGYGGQGVREWLNQNLDDAAHLMVAWYEQTTLEQATALCLSNREQATAWLIDIASEQENH